MSPIPVPEGALEAAERFRDVLRLVLPQGFEVGVGLKETEGEVTDVVSLKVYVPVKRPESEIPERERIPEQFEGFPVDVVESRIYLVADSARYDPLRGGIEISPPSTTIGSILVQHHFGTLGALVRRRTDNATLLLTCEHVAGPPSTDTHQPAQASPGTEVVGVVAATDVDLDCATVEPNGRRRLMSTIQDIGNVVGVGAAPAFRDAVKKRGRTTLVTHGTVVDVLPRQNPAIGKKWRVISVEPVPAGTPFCTHGDSGSALLNDADEVIGLIFAMGPDASGNLTRGWAVLMEDIQTVLGVDVATGITAAPPPFPGRLLRYPPLTIGADVEMWQQRMVDRGKALDVDGKYGADSKAVCQEFQREKGLDDDGIVGELTWDATFAED